MITFLAFDPGGTEAIRPALAVFHPDPQSSDAGASELWSDQYKSVLEHYPNQSIVCDLHWNVPTCFLIHTSQPVQM